VRLILEILNLRRILQSAGLRSEQNYRLEASEFCRIHQNRLVLAKDLVEGSHIRRQLPEIKGYWWKWNKSKSFLQVTSSFVMQVSPLALFSRLLQCSATEKRAQPVGSKGIHHWMAFSRN